MGELIKAEFKIKLTPKLRKFDPKNQSQEYQAEIFSELFASFPQFKAHVAAYVERNYCVVVNDEDHPSAEAVLSFLKSWEIRTLNEWIVPRKNQGTILR